MVGIPSFPFWVSALRRWNISARHKEMLKFTQCTPTDPLWLWPYVSLGPKVERAVLGGGSFLKSWLLLVMLGGVVLCCVWYICCLRYMFVFGFVFFGFGLFCVLYAVFIFLCNCKHAASLEKVELHPLPHSALPSPWGESHKHKNRPTNRTVSMTASYEAWQNQSETIKNIWSST